MIIDIHTHLIGLKGSAKERVKTLINYADIFKIDKLCLSLGLKLKPYPSEEEMREDNNVILEDMEIYPERIYGFCYLSGALVDASLQEMERCIEQRGMKGIKLWIAKRCNSKDMNPIIEKALKLKIPILQHTWLKSTGNRQDESTPDDLAELAKRYPEAIFVMAHAGGNWEYGIRRIKHNKNILIDLAGGDPEEGITELAVEVLGAERVVYGSDAAGRSFASQLAKVYGARITEEEKELILWRNAARILRI